MDTVIIDAEISQDGRLIYHLPPDLPAGRVKLTIQPIEKTAPIPAERKPLTLEEARRRLLAAGLLSTAKYAPEGAVSLSDEERERLADLFGGGPLTTLDLINEDRGPIGQ